MKLSELSMDAMLTVGHRDDGNIAVMSKEDFLNSAYFLDYPVEPFMEANPTYWEGEPIEVDIEICTEGEPKNHDVSRYRKYR